MINFAYQFNDKIKTGVLVTDNLNELKYNIPKGSKFWNLDKIHIENINDENYTGIGISDLHLKVELDEENS